MELAELPGSANSGPSASFSKGIRCGRWPLHPGPFAVSEESRKRHTSGRSLANRWLFRDMTHQTGYRGAGHAARTGVAVGGL
jgi:hypothetical protein